jgi:hypothetical protein
MFVVQIIRDRDKLLIASIVSGFVTANIEQQH